MRRRFTTAAAVVMLGALSLTACGSADEGSSDDGSDDAALAADGGSQDTQPHTIDNCGMELSFDGVPERVVTLNRPASEILLALGLKEHIIGVAGAPDETADPSVLDDFEALDVIVERDYPSSETLLDVEPDFLYSAYPSAYRDDGIGSRESFAEFGIPAFLSYGRCENRDPTEPLTVDEIWAEIEEMGRIFGVEDRAVDFTDAQRDELAETLDGLADLPPLSVFWWDMSTDSPSVGGCCGAPGMIIDTVGFENIFADLDGHWADASWEQVVDRDPDLIVIADFGDDDLDTKLDYLTSDPTLSQLRAVQEDAIVALPFHSTVPGIQTVDTVGVLAEKARELADAS